MPTTAVEAGPAVSDTWAVTKMAEVAEGVGVIADVGVAGADVIVLVA